MNILITHVYSEKNAGDAAILQVMQEQIQGLFPQAEIKYASAKRSADSKNTVSSFLYLCLYSNNGYLIKILRTIYILLASTLWAYTYKFFKINSYVFLPKETKKLCQAIIQADLILPVGGGYINGKDNLKSWIILIIQLHTLVIGKLLHKKIILYSQSIGPFGNKLQMDMACKVLKNMDGIIARENKTTMMLKKMGIKKNILHRSVDAAFIFDEPLRKSVIKSKTEKMIGITVRNWLPETQQELFEEQIAIFCKHLIEVKNYQVFLIPQVTSPEHNDDDRIPGKKIKNILKNNKKLILLEKSYTAGQLKNIYKDMNYLIGTRMHSVIFSLTENVPCIAIEYEYKTRGIMEELGLDRFTIKIEDVTAEKLIHMFNILEENRSKYLNTLKTSIKNYQKQAYNTGDLIKSIYLKSA